MDIVVLRTRAVVKRIDRHHFRWWWESIGGQWAAGLRPHKLCIDVRYEGIFMFKALGDKARRAITQELELR